MRVLTKITARTELYNYLSREPKLIAFPLMTHSPKIPNISRLLKAHFGN